EGLGATEGYQFIKGKLTYTGNNPDLNPDPEVNPNFHKLQKQDGTSLSTQDWGKPSRGTKASELSRIQNPSEGSVLFETAKALKNGAIFD
ncbi:MAG: hypothetical protein ACKO37_06570, partial [Vampirovibrionales bacterium]